MEHLHIRVGGVPGGDASLAVHISDLIMEMMSVKEQKITAATARLKDESDYRTIVLKIKTPPRYPRVVA
jgi:hypothetical protein